MSPKILIIDDEVDMVELISLNLRKNGFQVVTADSASQGLKRIQTDQPALILLDIMLPEMNGIEICKRLKSDRATQNIPVIMVSARGDEVDRILGLELGADDYITKPFSPRELVLRVKKVLQRNVAPAAESDQLAFRDILLDRSKHVVTVSGQTIDLTPTEFKLLGVLMERRGRVQSRDRLLNDVWDYEASIDTRTVDTHIRRLREKMGAASQYIETVRGVGYRFLDGTATE